MNDRNDTYIWNETEKNAAKTAAPRRNKKTVSLGRRLTALVLSAALFGAVSAGTFYGVGRLLPQEESISIRAEDADAVITSLASTSYSTTRYGMDVSDIAAAALPSVVAITNISVQEVRSYFNRFGPNGAGRRSWRRPPAVAPASSSPMTAHTSTWSPMPMWWRTPPHCR
ncbi:MAG: hypothetical protein V8R40_04880 [Dysosmobacter sp.]